MTPAGTVIGDPQPSGDVCSNRDNTTSIDPNNKNIGDLLNARNVTWGWFQGGFRDCTQTHANKAGVVSKDYIPAATRRSCPSSSSIRRPARGRLAASAKSPYLYLGTVN